MPELGVLELAPQFAESIGLPADQAAALLERMATAFRATWAKGHAVRFEELGVLGPAEPLQTQDGESCLTGLAENPLQADEAARASKALQDLVKQAVTSGKAISVEGIGTWRCRRGKAKVVKDPQRGHRLIEPGTPEILFEPDPAAVVPGQPSIAFVPADSVRQAVSAQPAANVMVVLGTGDDAFPKLLQYYFRQAGWNVQHQSSVVSAIQELDPDGTHLVIVDADLPNYQQLSQALKCSRTTSLVPLLVLFPNGANLDAPTEFMVCGDEHVVQPFEVKKLLNIADAELVRASEEEVIFEQQVLFQFPTDDRSLDRANEFGHQLFEISGLREEGQVALSAAFREALGNAAQHGNRYRRDKKIEVLYLLDREKITCMVKDMGQGFNHERYVKKGRAGDAILAARERHKEGKLGGLGIMLMLRCVDKIEYNDIGNAVTLTKFLRAPEKPAGEGMA